MRGKPHVRRGLTLVELLTAITLSLILIAAITQFFQIMGGGVARARSAVEIHAKLRTVSQRLQEDLEGLTVPARPFPTLGSAKGYLEIIDGPRHDWWQTHPNNTTGLAPDLNIGDIDDVIMMTCKAVEGKFIGRIRAGLLDLSLDNTNFPTRHVMIESKYAEVIWWTQLDDLDGNGQWDPGETYTLRRRAMLIRPDLNSLVPSPNQQNLPGNINPYVGTTKHLANFRFLQNVNTNPNAQALLEFYNENDLSVRFDRYGSLVANSLEDLMERKNRIAHIPDVGTTINFPNRFDFLRVPRQIDIPPNQVGLEGEDIMLSNVMAFDLRVFDPLAPVAINTNLQTQDPDFVPEALTPGDPGYVNTNQVIGAGAYVDLDYVNKRLVPPAAVIYSHFSRPPFFRSQLYPYPQNQMIATYDTWTLKYESDGINQDNDSFVSPVTMANVPLIDEGTNAVDDPGAIDNYPGPPSGAPPIAPSTFIATNADGVVDSIDESETEPPYHVPLRGLRASFRVIDRNTRQVRQVTMTTNFTPDQ